MLELQIKGETIKTFDFSGGEVDITADESEGWKHLAHYVIETEPDVHEQLIKGDEVEISGYRYTVVNADNPEIVVQPC